MTQVAVPSHGRLYTAAGLRSQVRALTRPNLLFWNIGWLSVTAALGLSVLGILAISTTESLYAQRQLVHLAIALGAGAAVAVPHPRFVQRLSSPLIALVLALLVFVLLPWVPETIVRPRNGARRWINLMVTDVQPSELCKIAYVLALASYLRFRSNYRRLRGLILLLLMTFIPLGLILVEPDLGTALLFLPTLFAMVVAAGARIKHIVLIILIGLAAAPSMYPLLAPHQQNRIKAMIAQVKGDSRYENDIGYQGARAMTLVGAGGATGVGKDRAADLVLYNHLPEDHNDMVFAVVTCRWGLAGALTTWGLFGLFSLGGLLTAGVCKDPFGRLTAVGIVAVIFAQMAINTGMTTGLVPITGITLPFVSYGGSSLVTGWIMAGLLLSIGMRRPRSMARPAFEFDAVEEP